MSDEPAPEMKKCPYCGRMTAASANFCWWCARELAARPERPDAASDREPRRVPAWVWTVMGVLVLVGVVALVLAR